MNILRMTSWSPYVVGVGIGILSWFAFATADRIFVVLLFVAGTAMTFALYGAEGRHV